MPSDQIGLDFGDARRAAIDALHAATAIYTREGVVCDLLDRLGWPAHGGVLCDPSCGDGAFLEAAISALLDAEPDSSANNVLARVVGWELHAGACDEAGRRVVRVLERHGVARDRADYVASRVIINRDFLTEGPEAPAFDVIAGNPPYLRFEKVPELLRAEYCDAVPDHARRDLLFSFLDRCSIALREGGMAGFVTADRWLFNAGAKDLRAQLGARWRISHLDRLSVESAFYRPKRREKGSLPRVHPISVVFGPEGREITGDPIYPGAERLPKADCTLADIARIQLAPWLGPYGIFVVNQSQAERIGMDRCVPVADVKDFDGGRYQSRGFFAVRTEDDQGAGVMDHLQSSMHLMPERGLKNDYWLPPEPWERRFPLDSECLVVPRIAKSLRAMRLPAGVLPINHGLTVFRGSRHELDQIEAVLASDTAQQYLEVVAPRLENGYFSITTNLLRGVPVAGEALLAAA